MIQSCFVRNCLTGTDVIPHHVGCAVQQLEQSVEIYTDAFGLQMRSRVIEVRSQGVCVSFIRLAASFYLEFVMPTGDQARLASYLKTGFYHLCFLVEDLSVARDQLKARHFSPLPAFRSEAFAGAACQFFLSPQLHLIELAAISPQSFDTFFMDNLEQHR